jgi:hypothetical protein
VRAGELFEHVASMRQPTASFKRPSAAFLHG